MTHLEDLLYHSHLLLFIYHNIVMKSKFTLYIKHTQYDVFTLHVFMTHTQC